MSDLNSLRTFQGANSTTFHPIPRDCSLTVPELFEFHATNSPEHPFCVYADDRGKLRAICYPEAYRAIRRAASIVSGHYIWSEERYTQRWSGKNDEPPVLGILANADSISYLTLFVGVMHQGLTPFPISSRNSAVAVAHLISKTRISQLFVSPDPAIQRLAQQAAEVLSKEGFEIEILPVPFFEDLYNDNDGYQGVRLKKIGLDTTSMIFHSSGSTSFPKPIKFTNRRYLSWGTLPYFGDVDLCGMVIAVHSVPMFHAMGVCQLSWTICAGTISAYFKPSSPPIIPTPGLVFDAIQATCSQVVYCVPLYVETWAKSPEKLHVLRQLQAIMYSGAPLNKATGDQLSVAGVTLTPFYGCTEIGSFGAFLSDMTRGDPWEYFRFSLHLDVELVPQEGSSDIFEIVVIESDTYSPNVLNTTVRGRPAYSTNDLVQRHETRSDMYRVYGRVDDQLILSTGEKVPILDYKPRSFGNYTFARTEHIICIMFGRGRFQNGVLIEPKGQFEMTDKAKLAAFRNLIWPTVEKVNEFAPAHSRIFKEMIIITSLRKPLEYTAKGTPRRQVCLNSYEPEINALYAVVTNSSQTELPAPEDWTPEATLTFVREGVKKVLQVPLKDDDDIFQEGCDSLQATWIRNTILHALRKSKKAPVHKISTSFVYSYPTIYSLSAFVSGLFTTNSVSNGYESHIDAKVQEMRAFLDKYSSDLRFTSSAPRWRQNGTSAGETVVLTGTTGRLGCHILAQLLDRRDVVRVYALNREPSGSDTVLAKRQRDAFKTWGLPVARLDTGRVTVISCELPKPRLGLSVEKYRQLQESVTVIIHNSWRVDFNLKLSSFEPLIVGLRSLIDLSLSSAQPGGPRFLFTSSISVVFNHPATTAVPEVHISDARVATGNGYSESKWVSEQLLRRATEQTGLRTTVVRVGQLSGDTHIGGWNTKEWVPALIKASQDLGCIPSKSQPISWISVDTAAAALVDMIHADERVLHLVHPRPANWEAVFSSVARALALPALPYKQWLDRLRRSSVEVTLLDFFEQGNFGDDVVLSTERAVCVSAALAGVRPLGEEDVRRYLGYWANVGFLKMEGSAKSWFK